MKTSEISITQDWLDQRCDAEGPHLLWRLNTFGGGPRGYLNGGQFSVRVAAWMMYHGKPIPAGKTARPCCGLEECLARKCLKLVPHGGYNRGKPRSLATRRKNAEALRAMKGVSPAVVQAIKAGGKQPKVLAAEQGVSLTTVYDIKNGRRWVDFAGPFSQLIAR